MNKQPSLQPIPYLSFPGTCREAVHWYERVLGGVLVTVMTTGESPIAAHCPEASHDDVLHARIELPGGGVLMAGDCPRHMDFQGMHGVALTLNYESTREAERIFTALAEGGKVTMPLQATFWAKTWGMLTDRFGVHWIVNGELLPL